MRNTAIVFTGQGSQFVGMGRDMASASPAAGAVFTAAEQALPGISGLMLDGPEEQLNETSRTQPAVYVVEMALWQAFKERWAAQMDKITCMAGHSLGEYSAFTAAGALTFAEGLQLVITRGQAMRAAGISAPGGMMVVLGLDDTAAGTLVPELQAAGSQVWLANLNAPGQVVFAGTRDALSLLQAAAMAKGAKRCLPLAVSVACHTPLMQGASDVLAEALAKTQFAAPWVPVIGNVDAAPLTNPELIHGALLRQLTSPVRWVDSINAMHTMGVSRVIEIGPKPVLAGLIQRIDRNLPVQSVTDMATMNALTWED